jgi:hypothetical protein
MKKYLIVLAALFLLAGCSQEAEASGFDCDGWGAHILNKCVEHPDIPEQEPNREEFDWGAYLHLILWESDDNNIEIGNWNTWEINRGEVTSLLGVKIYLNRLSYQGE